jgi:hypothetical protein
MPGPNQCLSYHLFLESEPLVPLQDHSLTKFVHNDHHKNKRQMNTVESPHFLD